MELWIRSQDKSALNCVRSIRINGLDIMCYSGEVLGTYSTRERALEVLDEIQNKIVINTGYVLATNSGIKPDVIKPDYCAVYEMPKE